MENRRLLTTLALLIVFIFIINYIGNKFYWYSSLWYFDMIMHFLGGFWVGLFFTYVFPPKNDTRKTFYRVLLFVLVIGIFWEIFEYVTNDVIAGNAFNRLDTLSDIFFDLSGGSLAVLYLYKRILFKQENGLKPGSNL